jgi:hypothetical protein
MTIKPPDQFICFDELTLHGVVEVSPGGIPAATPKGRMMTDVDGISPSLTESTVATPRDLPDTLPPFRSNRKVSFGADSTWEDVPSKRRTRSKPSARKDWAAHKTWADAVLFHHSKTCKCNDVASHFRGIQMAQCDRDADNIFSNVFSCRGDSSSAVAA